MRLATIILFGMTGLLFLTNQNAEGCDPATAAAFNQALGFNQYGFGQPSFATLAPSCGGVGVSQFSYSSGVGIPMRSYGVGLGVGVPVRYGVGVGIPAGYGGSFNLNARRIHRNNFGFAGFNNGFAPVRVNGFGNGGSLNINARRIRGNSINGAAAAAAAGATVNINARRGIRRNSF